MCQAQLCSLPCTFSHPNELIGIIQSRWWSEKKDLYYANWMAVPQNQCGRMQHLINSTVPAHFDWGGGQNQFRRANYGVVLCSISQLQVTKSLFRNPICPPKTSCPPTPLSRQSGRRYMQISGEATNLHRWKALAVDRVREDQDGIMLAHKIPIIAKIQTQIGLLGTRFTISTQYASTLFPNFITSAAPLAKGLHSVFRCYDLVLLLASVLRNRTLSLNTFQPG